MILALLIILETLISFIKVLKRSVYEVFEASIILAFSSSSSLLYLVILAFCITQIYSTFSCFSNCILCSW